MNMSRFPGKEVYNTSAFQQSRKGVSKSVGVLRPASQCGYIRATEERKKWQEEKKEKEKKRKKNRTLRSLFYIMLCAPTLCVRWAL